MPLFIANNHKYPCYQTTFKYKNFLYTYTDHVDLTKAITNFIWYEPFKMHSFFLLVFY